MINNPAILNKRVKIIGNKQTTKDGWDTTEPAIIATCWASIQPARGREYYEARAIRDDESIKIVIRYRTGITHDMQIQYRTHTYNIQSIVDPYEDHESLELYCVEKLRGQTPATPVDKGGDGW
jgi:SPP1 family predicted phage head-tail adaptor